MLTRAEHMRQKLSCVLVDEAQFLAPAQVDQLTEVADGLGIPVLCFGLRTDFQGNLFPGSERLLAVAAYGGAAMVGYRSLRVYITPP